MTEPGTPSPNRTPSAATAVIKFHASLNVSDLAKSVEFYTAMFGLEPVKLYPDYAKFEVETPPFVLSLKPKRACAGGPLNHLGLRVVTVEQLRAIQDRLRAVGARIGQQDDVKCCYALQTKIWVTDPDQTMWEVYVLHDDVPNWGEKDKKLKLLAPPFRHSASGAPSAGTGTTSCAEKPRPPMVPPPLPNTKLSRPPGVRSQESGVRSPCLAALEGRPMVARGEASRFIGTRNPWSPPPPPTPNAGR